MTSPGSNSLEHANEGYEDDRAESGHDQVTKGTNSRDAERLKYQTSQHGPYHADDQVTYQSKASAFHEPAGEPASNDTDNQEPDD
jgi:hypothetical protein